MKLAKILLAGLLAGCAGEPNLSTLLTREETNSTYANRKEYDKHHAATLRNSCVLYQTENGLFLLENAVGAEIRKISDDQKISDAKMTTGATYCAYLSQFSLIIQNQKGKRAVIQDVRRIYDWTSDHELWFEPLRIREQEGTSLLDGTTKPITVDEDVEGASILCYDTQSNTIKRAFTQGNIKISNGNVIAWTESREKPFEQDDKPDVIVYDASGQPQDQLVIRFQDLPSLNGLDAKLILRDVAWNGHGLSVLVRGGESPRETLYCYIHTRSDTDIIPTKLNAEKPLAILSCHSGSLQRSFTNAVTLVFTPTGENAICVGTPLTPYLPNDTTTAWLLDKEADLTDLHTIPNEHSLDELVMYLKNNTLRVKSPQRHVFCEYAPLGNEKILRLFDVKSVK